MLLPANLGGLSSRRPRISPSPVRSSSCHCNVHLAQLRCLVLHNSIFCSGLYLDMTWCQKLKFIFIEKLFANVQISSNKDLQWFFQIQALIHRHWCLLLSWLLRDLLMGIIPSWLFSLEFMETHEHVGTFLICGHFFPIKKGVGRSAINSLKSLCSNAVKRSDSLGP